MMVAETIPNHVAMVTGIYPDRNGIVANDFPDITAARHGQRQARLLLQSRLAVHAGSGAVPELVTAAVTSKDYLYAVMDHDRTGDGKVDADSNFDNTDDPTFIPGAGLTPDERTIAEALRVSREPTPTSCSSTSARSTASATPTSRRPHPPLPTGSAPAARAVQRTLTDTYLRAFVESLQADGRWDSHQLIVTADHSMDWSLPTADRLAQPAVEADPADRAAASSSRRTAARRSTR